MALLGDHFPICGLCSGYKVGGTHRLMMRNDPALCRCDEINSLAARPLRATEDQSRFSADRPEAKKSVTQARAA